MSLVYWTFSTTGLWYLENTSFHWILIRFNVVGIWVWWFQSFSGLAMSERINHILGSLQVPGCWTPPNGSRYVVLGWYSALSSQTLGLDLVLISNTSDYVWCYWCCQDQNCFFRWNSAECFMFLTEGLFKSWMNIENNPGGNIFESFLSSAKHSKTYSGAVIMKSVVSPFRNDLLNKLLPV